MEKPRIAIIDYKMCNLFSVEHACRYAGGDPHITSDPAEIESADAVILPGVGAYKDAMENIRSIGIDKSIGKAIAEKHSFLGICLGFQLLFSSSEEFGVSSGLGILEGSVKRFPSEHDGNRLKVPQIGWNQLEKAKETPYLAGIPENEYMYFVHSFYVEPKDITLTATRTVYAGFSYCSSVASGNLFACQFHPEKSAAEGMKIYRNWIARIR